MKKSKYNNPLISIITVVLNRKNTIEKTIKSVINQKYKNYELIIIDGGSSDGTMDIIKKYQNKIDLIISKKDKGIYNAMNKGLKYAKGDIIGILNSDDVYTKNALELVRKYFFKYDIDFLFGSVIKDRVLSGFNPSKIGWKFNIYPAHSSGFFISSKSHKIVGKYNESFKYHSDYDLIYRIVVKHKLKGMATNKKHITGVFGMHGITSRVSIFSKLIEEYKIRKYNKQNVIYLMFLFILKLLHKIISSNELSNKILKWIKNTFKLNY